MVSLSRKHAGTLCQGAFQFAAEVIVAAPEHVDIRLHDLAPQKVFRSVFVQKDGLQAGKGGSEESRKAGKRPVADDAKALFSGGGKLPRLLSCHGCKAFPAQKAGFLPGLKNEGGTMRSVLFKVLKQRFKAVKFCKVIFLIHEISIPYFPVCRIRRKIPLCPACRDFLSFTALKP